MDSLPPWPVVQSMLLSVVLPGFVVGAGVMAGVCAATRSEAGRWIGGALALVVGLAAGNFARGLLPCWSLELGWPSLFSATLLAVVGGVIAALAASRQGRCWGLAIRFITVVGCAFWLAPSGSHIIRLGFFALLLAAGMLNWEAFRHDGNRSLGRAALPALAIPWGASAATVLIYAHSARFFDLAVLQTATLVGVGFVAAMWRLDVTALFAVPTVFFPALMLGGLTNTFSEVPAASFVLVSLAPCALWILRLPPMRHWSGRVLATAAVAVVLVPCSLAVALAMRAESLDFSG